jgi:UDP-N-acetylglucosamine 2-epimerase
VSQEQIDRVIAAIKAEAAAVAKVQELLAEVKGKADDVQVRHLIDNGLPEATIIEIGGFGQDVIDAVKAAIAEEKREAERKAAEEAERKKAEAEGPAIEDIPEDELEEHVEAIQEIMEFSEDPDEIRTMCEQSNIPKALIDLAIEDADKLAALIE